MFFLDIDDSTWVVTTLKWKVQVIWHFIVHDLLYKIILRGGGIFVIM